MNKISSSSRLIAIDPSLTASGWALFSISTASPSVCGVISPPGPDTPMSTRLAVLQRDVLKLFQALELEQGDMLVCEGPAPLVLNPDSALKVERVRGIFESTARSLGIAVPGRINPRTVQTELLGMRGRQLARAEVKAWARETARKLFSSSIDSLPQYPPQQRKKKTLSQDVIDALLIGSLAVSRVKLSLGSNTALELAFESKGRSRKGCSRARWREEDLERHLNRS